MIDVGKDLPKKLDDVPGWLSYGDQLVFQWLLEWQSRTQEPSDLVEVGVYKGKSAIHLGRFLR
ncbi:MAG: class I SAM-dependent methyltransferase, partial [Candidatus Microthrix parvicella]